MKKLNYVFMIAVVVLGSAFAFATQAHATGGGNGDPCYYHLWTCSDLDDNGYWSGCNPNYAEGVIPYETAKIICTTYHQ